MERALCFFACLRRACEALLSEGTGQRGAFRFRTLGGFTPGDSGTPRKAYRRHPPITRDALKRRPDTRYHGSEQLRMRGRGDRVIAPAGGGQGIGQTAHATTCRRGGTTPRTLLPSRPPHADGHQSPRTRTHPTTSNAEGRQSKPMVGRQRLAGGQGQGGAWGPHPGHARARDAL